MNTSEKLHVAWHKIDRKLFDQMAHTFLLFKGDIGNFFSESSVKAITMGLVDTNVLLDLYMKLFRKESLEYLEMNEEEILLFYTAADLTSKKLLTEHGEKFMDHPKLNQALGLEESASPIFYMLRFNQQIIAEWNQLFKENPAFEARKALLEHKFPLESMS